VAVADRTRTRTRTRTRAVAWAGACAVAAGTALAGAALAGCSSSPGPAAQAQAERSAVLPVAKQLRGQVAGAGVGWTASILGDYEACGVNDPLATSRGGSMLQYTARQLTTPFSSAVSFATFARQVVAAVNAAGWQLRPVGGPSDQGRYYAGRRDGFDLRLVEFNDTQGLGPTATIYVSGSCFDAGSSAQSFVKQGAVDNVTEPRPTSTPTPRYS
jgi:hypothetical protein